VGSSVARGGRAVARRVREEAHDADRRAVVGALNASYRDNDLLTYASAISFQVFFALIPLLLFALGLIGFLSLQDAWQQDIAPEIQANVSSAAYKVINDTVRHVLNQKQLFWATFGALLAVWEISGAVRAVMQVFNRIYGVEETRPFWKRMRVSLWLAAATGGLLLAAVAIIRFVPFLFDIVLGERGWFLDLLSILVRWGIGLSLLLVVVGLLVRHAPDCKRPLHWVSFGAVLVVSSWSVMSIGFSLYVTQVADYASLFGSLATVIVTMTYLYWSTIVFLTGVQLDALVRGGFQRALDAAD
jgi:membrane protein